MRYRDTKTGRLVSAATWRRSRAHGGTRFKREVLESKASKTAAPRTNSTARRGRKRAPAVGPAAPPRAEQGGAPSGGAGARFPGIITGPIPIEFLDYVDDFFESGWEADEVDEYA